jgi:hypothetical protein
MRALFVIGILSIAQAVSTTAYADADLGARIQGLERILDSLVARGYGEHHPDVLSTKRVIAELKQQKAREETDARELAKAREAGGGRLQAEIEARNGKWRESKDAGVGATGFDVKGIVVGAPVTKERLERTLGVKCEFFWGPPITMCMGTGTFAEQTAEIFVSVVGDAGQENMVESIYLNFSLDTFTTLAPLLLKKFGNPNSGDASTVQNAFGARYEQVEIHWKGSNGEEALYQKYCQKITESCLLISRLPRSDARQVEERRRADM